MVQGIVIRSPLIYVIQACGKNIPNVHKISAERERLNKKINYILLNKQTKKKYTIIANSICGREHAAERRII